MAAGFLEGVTVLNLGSVGPSARAARWLGDYGASIVNIGPVPSREGVQLVPPFYAYSGHRGVKRVLIDFKAPDGREAFLRLAEKADVIIESFRPGVVARLGIGYDDVVARNPGIVYCATTGFGQSGPHALWAGHDINYLAVSGYLQMTEPGVGGKPPVPGATIADSTGGGMHAVMSICAALVSRSKTGEGAYLDVCIADGMLSIMALAADEYMATGVVPGPGHGLLTGRYACYDTYPAGDGRWLSFGAIEGRFWANLCKQLGLEQWAAKQYDDDVEVQAQIRADVRAVLATKSRDEWVAQLAPADTCVAPVFDVTETIADEQYNARGAIVDAVHPVNGSVRQVGALLAGQVRPDGPFELPDHENTDTDELLQAAGYSPADCVKLHEAGVIA